MPHTPHTFIRHIRLTRLVRSYTLRYPLVHAHSRLYRLYFLGKYSPRRPTHSPSLLCTRYLSPFAVHGLSRLPRLDTPQQTRDPKPPLHSTSRGMTHPIRVGALWDLRSCRTVWHASCVGCIAIARVPRRGLLRVFTVGNMSRLQEHQ